MVRAQLSGARVLVTGVTGFIGQAVLERLLVEIPDARPVALVRPRGRRSGRDRLLRLLEQPVLARWREQVGDEEARRRLTEDVDVVEGDLAHATPALPGDLDVVLHCAASVSFDPPIDEGFATNVSGTVHLYEALHAAGARPHVVHVSTAYVAGDRKGVVAEAPLEHGVDWRAELAAAQRAREDAENASREPGRLEALLRRAGRTHRRAGPQTTAADAERRRVAWVHERLVAAGRSRARSLGWPDVYTLTKALGERAAEELSAESGDGDALPLSILRPSIVESALRHPYPGWIEGFKMADPIIVAYGQGVLPEFPGIPEGVVDLIPVDFVANGILAAAAHPPEPGTSAYYHVSSGARNPLTFHRLYELVREHFDAHPMPQRDRGEVPPPTWSFPGRRQVERQLGLAERALETADRALDRLPSTPRTQGWMTRVHRRRRQAEFLRRYADLYGAYAEAEVIYTDDAALALHRSIGPDEQATLGFDAAEIDWAHYLGEVHCPAVTAVMRHVPARSEPRVPEPEPVQAPALAVFDLEGTLLASNVVESYLWLRLADLPWRDWPGELTDLARSLPRHLADERRDRNAFLRGFYRRYAGADLAGLQRLAREQAGDLVLSRAAPAGLRQVRAHRRQGHRTVLLTGALELFVDPLRPLFDEVVAARLEVRDGRCTGYLTSPPLAGEARAEWLRDHVARAGGDLGASYAYGDSHSDLPMLERVGHPVAVNPDAGLYRAARARRWPVAHWNTTNGGMPAFPAPAPVGRPRPRTELGAGGGR